MILRRLMGVVCICFFVLVTSTMAAPTVTISQGSYQYGSGGEFAAIIGNGGDASLPDGYQFQTFCIEKDEFLNFGGTYYYTVNTVADAGGVGGGAPDPLDSRTAWLYNEFTKQTNGALAGMYDFSNANGLRTSDAGQLQDALWSLENELTSALSVTSKAYDFVQLAEQSDWYANNMIGDVRILNLFSDAAKTQYAQDVLVKGLPAVPVPGAMLLAGLGTVCAGYLRRRRLVA